MDDILEEKEQTPVVVPQLVKVLAILVYLGNACVALLMILVFLWAIANPDSFEAAVQRQAPTPNACLLIIVISLVVCVLPIIGAAFMSQGKKTGFWIFSGVNLLWIFLNFKAMTPGNITLGIISCVFIAVFATQLKHLR